MERCGIKGRSGCPISFSLDLFGDSWSLLVLRDLILGGKQRFGEMLASDEGIASNILADRLRRLEQAGIVTRAKDPEDGRQVIYRATAKGSTLVPVLLEMAAWGASHDPDTAAPPGFVERFHADRQAFYDNPRERIAALFAEAEQKDGR